MAEVDAASQAMGSLTKIPATQADEKQENIPAISPLTAT